MRIFAPQYTQTPNQLFDDWLPKLNFVQLKVLMVILRKTFGWHKVRDRISISQLEELTGAQRQAILKAAKDLEKMGLITKIVVGSKGQQQTFYELIVIEDSNNSYQCDGHTPTSVMNTLTKETLTKEIVSPIVPKGDPIVSSKRKVRKEEYFIRSPEVRTTPTQHQTLLDSLKGDEAKLTACYQRLSDWKIGKQLTGGLGDFGQIKKWVIQATEEDLLKGKVSSQSHGSEKNKEIAQKLCQKLNHPEIEAKDTFIFFVNNGNGHSLEINYKDFDFKQKVTNRLRKMGIAIEVI